MKTLLNLLTGPGATLMLLALLSCTQGPMPGAEQQQTIPDNPKEESKMPDKIHITIDGKTLSIVLETNDATQAGDVSVTLAL